MAEVSIRELRNNGAAVMARVTGGESLTVTRDGEPVAEIRPLPRRPLGATALVERFRWLPPEDPWALRADVDAILDPSL